MSSFSPNSKRSRRRRQRRLSANKALAEKHLISFIRQAWHVLEPSNRFIWGWHIEAIADHLQAITSGEIRNLLINLPPRHMKSLTVSVFWPVWEWIANPQRRWLYASYALGLAVRDSLKCRRLIESTWFQARWGDRFRLTDDQNTKLRFDNDRGGSRIATSVGGSATGEGGDRVVVDDPHNVTQRESDSIRRATLTWWDETMSTRLNDPKTGAKVIVMQRVHEKDLSGHVLEQGGYVHLCLPAEFEPGRRCVTTRLSSSKSMLPWTDPRDFEGELLWPARIRKSEISDFKLRLGPSGYAGQFQQRPTPADGARFDRKWFRYYRCDTGYQPVISENTGRLLVSRYHLIQPSGTERTIEVSKCDRFAIMDPAGTEADQNTRPCYTVIQVWDVTDRHEMLLVHQYRAQVQTPDAVDAAVRIVHDFNCEHIAVEKDGIGLGVVQAIRRAGVTVKSIKCRGSKEARSETAEIRMAAGSIYFPTDAPFLFDLEQELLHFPKGEYSDQVDALAHAAIEVHKRSGPPATPPEPSPPQEDILEYD